MAHRAWTTLAARWLIAAAASVSVGAQSDATANGCDGLMGVRSTERYLHPWSEAIELRRMVDAEGMLLPVEPRRVDIRVLGPRTVYSNDRPAWMRMDGRRRAVAISTPECVEAACVVEATNVAWEEQGVPYDRIEVVEDAVDMYLPPGVEVALRAYRLDGRPAFQRTVSTGVTGKETPER